MPFATTAALVGAGIAGSLGGAALASHGAGKAAKAQSDAGLTAAQLQAKSSKEALDFQKQEYADQQKNQAPWLQAGQGAVGKLSDLVQNGGFPDWNKQFQAPTDVTEQNDPGFQFRLQQGEQALQRSAAAKGGLLSGGTAKALTDYGQQAASGEYGNVYNRALGQYQQSYNEYQQNQANTYNRLAGLSGTGQVAAGQLAQSGQATAGNVGNILLGSANAQGNDIQNAAAARASGYVGGANAYGGAIGGIGNSIQQQILLSQLGYFGGGGNTPNTGGA